MNMAADRKQCPAKDIVSTLVAAEDEGNLGSDEFGFFVLMLSVACNQTTRNAITHGMHAFLTHPEQWELYKSTRPATTARTFVRWATPVVSFQRTATQDTELGGKQIKKGDRVGIFYASANHDPAKVLENPDTFDITRDPNPHLGFGGGGPHYCLGKSLAVLEIDLIFNAIADAMPDLTLVGDPRRLRSAWINGVVRNSRSTPADRTARSGRRTPGVRRPVPREAGLPTPRPCLPRDEPPMNVTVPFGCSPGGQPSPHLRRQPTLRTEPVHRGLCRADPRPARPPGRTQKRPPHAFWLRHRLPLLVTLPVLPLYAVWWAFLATGGGDLAAQVAWAEFVARHGGSAYNLFWYGGMHTANYSLISPYLMAALVVPGGNGLVSWARRHLAGRRADRPHGDTAAGGPRAAGLARTVVQRRLGAPTFALGVALGLAACVLLTGERRTLQAAAYAALATMASPVAGLFLVVVGAGHLAVRDRARAAAPAVPPVVVVGATTLLFPFAGQQLMPSGRISAARAAGADHLHAGPARLAGGPWCGVV